MIGCSITTLGAVVWYIHYKTREVDGLRAVSTLSLAIKQACDLLDQGTNVNEIEGSGAFEGLNADEIRAAYAERKYG
jgi:hypothetical protein